MQYNQFIASRKKRWGRLEQLTNLVNHHGVARLSGDEILELGALYRSTTSDLAIARRDFGHDPVAAYLNTLLARAHPVVYRERGAGIAGIGRFVRYGFPAAYRAAAPYTLLAFGVFLAGALISALLVAIHPSMADVLLPGDAAARRQVLAQHHLWMQSATENHSVAADFIMVNNIKVVLVAFAGGMLVGIPTIAVLAYNGIMLGTIGAMVAQYGLSRPFWAFIVPHGAIELSVIFLAGGTGLMVGDAILRPGLATRARALTDASHTAIALVGGSAALLVIAGTFEGFFSPSDVPDGLKFAVGGFNLVWLYVYLLGSRPHVRAVTYRFEDLFREDAVGYVSQS